MCSALCAENNLVFGNEERFCQFWNAMVRCRRFRRRFGQSGPNLLPDRMAFGHHSLGWFALIFSAPLLLGFPARYKRCKGIACRRGNGRAYSQI